MKKLIMLLLILSVAFAIERGPRGGKLIESGNSTAEILIQPSGIISVGFYDKDKKQIEIKEQEVYAIAETGVKTKLNFSKIDNFLVSAPLPKGEGYLIVVQIKDSVNLKPHNIRLKYEMHKCMGCNLSEYACICDH